MWDLRCRASGRSTLRATHFLDGANMGTAGAHVRPFPAKPLWDRWRLNWIGISGPSF
jgi:hypothetical protein